MSIPATVYKASKGKGSASYLATSKREYLEEYDGKAVFLETPRRERFPAVVRKLRNGRGSFTYCFNIPDRIAQEYENKQTVEFNIVCESEEGLLGLPPQTIREYPLYTFKVGEEVLCWIYTKGCKPYALPNTIPLEKGGYSLFELYGAFLCEGFKARKKTKHRDRLSFANAEISEIKWFIEACEALLGIRKAEWGAQILFPKSDEETVSGLRLWWVGAGLKPKNIRVCENRTVAAENGVCLLLIYNSTLAEVFHHIMEQAEEKMFDKEEYCWEFFRGLSRGDLGVTMKPNGIVKAITFTTENEENMRLFQAVCERIGLTTNTPYFVPGKKGKWEAQIMGYENFKRVIRNNGVVHEKRKQRLTSGFLKANKSTIHKYLKAVGEGAATTPKARDALGISIVTATATFAKYCSQGYLAKAGKNGKAVIHELTPKGQKALEFYENLYKGLNLE